MTPTALPLGEERYTPTDGAEIVSGDHLPGGRKGLPRDGETKGSGGQGQAKGIWSIA